MFTTKSAPPFPQSLLSFPILTGFVSLFLVMSSAHRSEAAILPLSPTCPPLPTSAKPLINWCSSTAPWRSQSVYLHHYDRLHPLRYPGGGGGGGVLSLFKCQHHSSFLEQTGQCVGFTICSQILRHSPLENVKLRSPALGCGLNLQLVSKEQKVERVAADGFQQEDQKALKHLPCFTGSLHQGVKLPGLWTLRSVEKLTPPQATSTRECTTLQEDPPAYPAGGLEPNILTEYQKKSQSRTQPTPPHRQRKLVLTVNSNLGIRGRFVTLPEDSLMSRKPNLICQRLPSPYVCIQTPFQCRMFLSLAR